MEGAKGKKRKKSVEVRDGSSKADRRSRSEKHACPRKGRDLCKLREC